MKAEFVALTIEDRKILISLCKAYCFNKDFSQDDMAVRIKKLGDKLFRVSTSRDRTTNKQKSGKRAQGKAR